MRIYVLIASDKTVSGIYTSQNQLIAELSTTFASLVIDKVEIWETDKGFVDYLKVNKKTTITIEN